MIGSIIPSQEELDAHEGYVYKITNIASGVVYIGKHHHRRGERWNTYKGSGRLLKVARTQFGEEAFTKSLVCLAAEVWDLYELEDQHIGELVDNRVPTYNTQGYKLKRLNQIAFALDAVALPLYRRIQALELEASFLQDQQVRESLGLIQ